MYKVQKQTFPGESEDRLGTETVRLDVWCRVRPELLGLQTTTMSALAILVSGAVGGVAFHAISVSFDIV